MGNPGWPQTRKTTGISDIVILASTILFSDAQKSKESEVEQRHQQRHAKTQMWQEALARGNIMEWITWLGFLCPHEKWTQHNECLQKLSLSVQKVSYAKIMILQMFVIVNFPLENP